MNLPAIQSVEHQSGAAVVCRGWADGWRMPEAISLSAWSDRHRILPRKASSEPGRWRTERTPYAREIMDSLSQDDPCREIVFIACTQIAKTEILNNWCAYVVDHAPAPMMIVQPTLDLSKRWSKQRLAPMIEEMPVLAEKVRPSRSRDSGNTTLVKEFRGGMIVISGANSAASLRSMPVKYIAMDEIDGYPDDLDGEGDPIDLAEARTSNFPRRKIFKTSTPTMKGSSNIDAAYQKSDRRLYHVPCPHCTAEQPLTFDQLTEDGQYLCGECGELIDEHHKTEMLANGRWIARNPDSDVRGYRLNSLYSPIGLGYSWVELAQQREEARDDKSKEKTFTNLRRGEAYEDPDGRLDADDIATLAGQFKMREIPPGCLLVSCGVDVQINRFAIQLLGFGRNNVWTIDWIEIPADPTDPDSWDELTEYLRRPLVNSYGIEVPISMTAVDSGNWTHEVYRYVRHAGHRIIAIKGMSTSGRPVIGRASWQDINFRGKTIRRGVQLWPVGTDTAKNTLLGRISKDIGKDPENRRHTMAADLPDDYYTQLTAERVDPETGVWKKLKGKRNEAIDTMVYAYAAACHPLVRLHSLRDSDWNRLEEKLEPRVGDMFSGVVSASKGAPPIPAGEIARKSTVKHRTPPQPSGGFGSEDWAL